MATQWADPTYIDDDFTIASPIGLPVFQSPIPAINKQYLFTQEFMQALEFFEETPLNTPHDSDGLDPDYSSYFLVSEGPRQDVLGGMVKWTRTYAMTPDSYDEYESYGYQFIGFSGLWIVASNGSAAQGSVTGRPRELHVVTSRVRHDFFKTGPGAPYASPGNIPTISAQEYTVVTSGGTETVPTNYLSDSSTVGALTFPATTPSRATYKTWMTNAVDNGWTSATSGAGQGQIAAEDSRLSRWHGNIFVRQVRYLLAQ